MQCRFAAPVAATVAATIVLAACGETRKNASVGFLLGDEQALLDEMSWCGTQRNPEVIEGCRNAADAVAINSDPAAATPTASPEPLQDKDASFFRAVADTESAQDSVPEAEAQLEGDQQQVERAEHDLQGLPAANARRSGDIAEKRTAERQLREGETAVGQDRAELAKLNAAIAEVPQDARKKVRDEASWCAARSERIGLGYPGHRADATSCAGVHAVPEAL